GDDCRGVPRQVQAVQGLECLVAVVVGEIAGKGGLLTDLVDLAGMPGGVACQQDPAAPGVGEDADAAGGVAGEVDQDDAGVAEQVVAAGEGEDGRAVEVVFDEGALLQGVAHAADRG